MRSTQRRLIWILLAAVVLLMCVAVVSAALFILLQQRPGAVAGWQEPIAEIVPGEISPDLALYPLAGASELETVDVALANRDLETAYVALVFSLELTDAQRIGRLINLGRQFAEVEKPERAHLCYQQVYDLAVLSPKLSDPARADALLAAGNGWADLGQASHAYKAYDQVKVIAVHSPFLQMANRRELLNALRLANLELGDEDQAAVYQQQIIDLDQAVREPSALPVAVPDLPMGEGAVSTAEVGALEEARRGAAFALISSFPNGGPSAELVDTLAAALVAEDTAKLALYQRALAETTQPGKRVAVHWQTIHWLTLKYRVAMQGFGLSLVPDWEAQVPEIQSGLSQAYEDLFFDYEDLVTALPDASLMGPGAYVVRRRMNLAGRLGQYPIYPAQQMADKLREAVAGLIASGAHEQLFVDVAAESGELRFFLNPAQQYGQPPQSP